VFWCFGWLFGLIAFVLAIIAADSETSGKREEATRLGRASLGVSIAGIVVGVIVAVAIGIYLNNSYSTTSDPHSHYTYG